MESSYKRIVERNIVHEWTIDNISVYLDDFDTPTELTLKSLEFSTGAKIKDKWCIVLKVIHSIDEDNGKKEVNLNFYLRSMNGVDEIDTKVSFFFLNNEKKKSCIKEYRLLLSKGDTEIFSIRRFELYTKHGKDNILPDNTMTVCLELSVYDTPSTTYKKLELNILKRQIANDYKHLYETKIGSDVVINVGDTNFKAHKNILKAQSPVLASMFPYEMIEKKESKISIPDITPKVFEKFLEYIYTDKVTGLDEIADGLLEAADKYQIQPLKDICQESLSKTLNAENALKIMNIADVHNAKELLKFTNDFIASNFKDFVESQDFKDLEKSNIDMAFELFKKFRFYY